MGLSYRRSAGKAAGIFQLVKDRLSQLNPPSLDISQKEMFASFYKRLKGEKKTFLRLQSKNFDSYVLNLCSENYGNQLIIAWYLTARPSLYYQFVNSLPDLLFWILYPILIVVRIFEAIFNRRIKLQNMDIFEKLELRAFAGTIHHAATFGSQEISNSVGFDFTKVDLHTKGFFNLT